MSKNIVTINIDLDELMNLLKRLGGDNQLIKAIIGSLVLQKEKEVGGYNKEGDIR